MEIAAMKEDGLVSDFWQWWELPEPVKVGWRLMAEARQSSRPHADGAPAPTQDLLALEMARETEARGNPVEAM